MLMDAGVVHLWVIYCDNSSRRGITKLPLVNSLGFIFGLHAAQKIVLVHGDFTVFLRTN